MKVCTLQAHQLSQKDSPAHLQDGGCCMCDGENKISGHANYRDNDVYLYIKGNDYTERSFQMCISLILSPSSNLTI